MRSHKFRLDPTAEQVETLEAFGDARRKAYNWALGMLKEIFEQNCSADGVGDVLVEVSSSIWEHSPKQILGVITRSGDRTDYRFASKQELIGILTRCKKTLDWSEICPSRAVEMALGDAAQAVSAFWKRRKTDPKVGYPRFLAQREHKEDTFTVIESISILSGKKRDAVKLPKLPPIKICGSTRHLEREIIRYHGLIKEATVSVRRGHWWVSLMIERDAKSEGPEVFKEVDGVGDDLGLKTLHTLSNGQIVENPRFLRASSKKRQEYSRSVARKTKAREQSVVLEKIEAHQKALTEWSSGEQSTTKPEFLQVPLPSKSNRLLRAEDRLRRLDNHIANGRHTFHRQIAAKLIPAYPILGVEDLAIANMVQNHHLAKSIMDAGWRDQLNCLETRATDHGTLVIAAKTFFASSQLCSVCGYKNPLVKDLKVREWTCPDCCAHHLRDLNAAQNLRPTQAQIDQALADRQRAREKYEKHKQQISERAIRNGAIHKAKNAARKAKTMSRAASSIVTNHLIPRSVASMPEETLTRAWSHYQTDGLPSGGAEDIVFLDKRIPAHVGEAESTDSNGLAPPT